MTPACLGQYAFRSQRRQLRPIITGLGQYFVGVLPLARRWLGDLRAGAAKLRCRTGLNMAADLDKTFPGFIVRVQRGLTHR